MLTLTLLHTLMHERLHLTSLLPFSALQVVQKRQRLSPEILTSLLMAAKQIDEDGKPLTDKLGLATTWCAEQGATFLDELDDVAQQDLASTCLLYTSPSPRDS